MGGAARPRLRSAPTPVRHRRGRPGVVMGRAGVRFTAQNRSRMCRGACGNALGTSRIAFSNFRISLLGLTIMSLHICVTNEEHDLWFEEIKRLALRLVQELDAFRNSHCITEETTLTYQEFEIDALQVQVEPDVKWCAEQWYELVY